MTKNRQCNKMNGAGFTTTTTPTTTIQNCIIIIFLLIALQFERHNAFETVQVIAASAKTKTRTATTATRACFYFENNVTISKAIGAEWASASEPCRVFTCAAGSGVADDAAHIAERRIQCGEIYCDVDSELQSYPGSCCPSCVRTRCRYESKVYEIGQTWRNASTCTRVQCVQLPNGQPEVVFQQPDCPAVPADCPPEHVYTLNCCQYCANSRFASKMELLAEDELGEMLPDAAVNWTPEFYRAHRCNRDCTTNAPPMTCYYTFEVEWYQTMSKACFDCPHNLTDCFRPHCIAGDGLSRSVTVVNRMMPGPAIEVCANDVIIVDVRNRMLGESTSMHWHGLHQRETPYMDGVPHITQCPISPHASFRYTFKADSAGTQFWHSHTGMQRGDGMFGALIIRQPKLLDPHAALYDFDLSEHVMIVQDWVHEPGVSLFSHHYHSAGDNKPRTLLINGRGRFYNHIWEQAREAEKARARNSALVQATTTSTASPKAKQSNTGPPKVQNQSANKTNDRQLQQQDIRAPRSSAEAARNSALPEAEFVQIEPTITMLKPLKVNTTAEQKISRRKRANDPNAPLHEIPHQVYTVTQGFRYRFRIINAEFLNCPIVVSVDNHTLMAINSDGYDFKPVPVSSIVTYAGERFDFVLHANQSVGNYWVRLKGLMDCGPEFTSAFQVAILRYKGAPTAEPTAMLTYGHKPDGIELNVMNQGSGHADALTAAELQALPVYDNVPGVDRDALKAEPDYKFYLYYDFYHKNHPEYHNEQLYPYDANMTQANRVTTPQMNHISLRFPSMALLPSRYDVSDAQFCNETSLAEQGIDCRKQFCKCHHVLQFPLNAIVEFVIVDEGFGFNANHPFHLHGNAFRVVALERISQNVTIEMVKKLDEGNALKRNLRDPPVKDTVTIPDGGYTIIRFEAYNPGFWLFHCHIEFHAEVGMAIILKVGDNDQMPPVPPNFPTCSDYMPDPRSTTTPQARTTPPTQQQQPRPVGSAALHRNHIYYKFHLVFTVAWLYALSS